MKFFATLLLLGGSAAAADRVTMETDVLVAESYRNWASTELTADAKSANTMDVYFMMKHDAGDLKILEKTLYAVSDPDSEAYGNHLSLEQLKQLTPVAPEAVKAVTGFLTEAGVDASAVQKNHNEDIITATVTLEQAEQLFDTEIRQYTHNRVAAAQLYRASAQYSLPEEVADVVSFVGDLVRVPAIQGVKRVPLTPEKTAVKADVGDFPNSCTGLCTASEITPGALLERYNITDTFDYTSGAAATSNSFAVAEFQGQYFDNKDLEKFSNGCNVNVTVDHISGDDRQEGGVEAMLDIEYIKGVTPDVPLTFYYQNEYSLLKWATALSSDDSAPLIHSVSYGNDEAQQTGSAYIFSCSTQFQKLGTRGLSILFASGDQGVCGREGCGLISHKFHPDFPAACPYITAVGGTDFLERSTIGDEKAWTDGGGGFSDHFDIPSFQTDAVSKYKADPSANLPPQKMWNNTGRGYPDVAALGGMGNPYCVVAGGVAQGVAGTSASCPVTAAVFARLNGIRLAAGKPALGWLNPFIYKNADAFNDVTEGKNSGGGLGGYGFKAIAGWDAATGVGTPNYGKLAEAVQALP